MSARSGAPCFRWSCGPPALGLLGCRAQLQQPGKWLPRFIVGNAVSVDPEPVEKHLIELPSDAVTCPSVERLRVVQERDRSPKKIGSGLELGLDVGELSLQPSALVLDRSQPAADFLGGGVAPFQEVEKVLFLGIEFLQLFREVGVEKALA